MEKAIIIARCSTNERKQDVQRQVVELKNKYSNMYNIVDVIEYYQSGTKNQETNKATLKRVIENNIQNIIVSEISRIGRRVIEVLNFIDVCNNNKVNVIISNYNMHSLTEQKEPNSIVQTMLQIAATFSNMELQLTKERLNSGRRHYIEKGGTLGRKSGSAETDKFFLQKHKDIEKHLKQELSIRMIAKLTNKSNGTIQKVKRLLVEKGINFES